jgi:hypothetical protein
MRDHRQRPPDRVPEEGDGAPGAREPLGEAGGIVAEQELPVRQVDPAGFDSRYQLEGRQIPPARIRGELLPGRVQRDPRRVPDGPAKEVPAVFII